MKGQILAGWAQKFPEPWMVSLCLFFSKKIASLPANGRAARALRPVAAEPDIQSKSASLLVGACDWPSHQHVWAGHKTKPKKILKEAWKGEFFLSPRCLK